jgi:hypothetical protein
MALADLPGYGFAKISKKGQAEITRFIERYFEGRAELRLVVLIVDARREPQRSDREVPRRRAVCHFGMEYTTEPQRPAARCQRGGRCVTLEWNTEHAPNMHREENEGMIDRILRGHSPR